MAKTTFQERMTLKLAKFQFGGKVRGRTYKKLATFLKNGVPLSEALTIMWRHTSEDGKKRNDPTALILNEWRKRVGNGDTFGTAISGWVPEGDRVIIDGGEKAGLHEAIMDAIKINAAGKKILKTIWLGAAYPIILTIVALGFMIMFSVRIVPAFTQVLPRSQWQGSAATMANIADGIYHYLVPGLVAFGFVCFAVSYTMPRWVGRIRVIADKYPPWSLYRLYAGAGFMLVLSAMTKAGVQMTEILRTLKRGSLPWYDERIGGALRHVSNGENIGEALWLTGLNFPDAETVKDLRSYAEQDGFEEILRELGEQWIEESIEKVQAQTGAMRNVGFIVFGIVFGGIASATFGLEQQVTAAAK